MYGLSNSIIEKIREIQSKINKKMVIFGSRARENYKEYSDIDIAVVDNVTTSEKYDILNEFDKIDCEYKFDIVFIQNIENNDFLENIKKEGRVIWIDMRRDLKILTKL